MSSSAVTGVIWLVLLAGAGWFLLIRPTRRRAQEVRSLQNALAVESEVMLTSGIFGRVTSIDDEHILVEVADGVVLTVHRGAIAKVLTAGEEAELDEFEDDEFEGDDPDVDGERDSADLDPDESDVAITTADVESETNPRGAN